MGLTRLLCLVALLTPQACLAPQAVLASRAQQEEEHETSQHVGATQAVPEYRRCAAGSTCVTAIAQLALREPKLSPIPPLTVTGHRLACGHCAPLLC